MSREARQDRLPLTCVIGAGPSGLTAAKALQDMGVPFDCFERSGRVGGLWAFDNPRGTPTAYRSLRPNTSKARTEFEDLPMPADYADFPTHLQIAAYLEDYAERFGLRDRITFGTAVERAELEGDGAWRVTLEGGETRSYDALIVANGHHWDPLWPDPPFPGHLDGVQIHARDYVDPEGLEGKTVVVVGTGNSAMDIAVDVSRVAARTVLSARRGTHILPTRLLGRPLDQIETIVPHALRPAFGGRLTGLAMRAGRIQRPQEHGLPVPDHPLGAEPPTLSDEICARIDAGAIVVRPNLAELAAGEVRFQDGSVESADLVIYCTGYRVSFPFFDPGLIAAPGNSLPLFHRVFMPSIPNVFFIGLAQPIGPTIRLVEAQSKWVAAHLAGVYTLPSREQMERAIAADEERRGRRFRPSPRHAMVVDFWPYLREISRELRRGRRRGMSSATTDDPAVRIGIDLTALLPQWTGIDNYMIGLVTHLAKLDKANRYVLFVNREDRALFDGCLPPNFRVVAASLRPRPARLLFQQALLPLASTRLDVVHSPAFLMPVVKGSARHLLTVVDLTFFSMPEHHGSLHRSTPFQRAVLSAIKRADRITVPTGVVKQDVLEQVPELEPDRIDVIGYGVGEQFRPHSPAESSPVLERLGLRPGYVLYLGTVEPRKNLETLLEAYADLLSRGETDTQLVIAGKLGWDYEGLLRRLEQPDLQGKVHLPGYIAAADLPALYAGARLFVYPSWAEGFGFPPLEAMASGVPVIAGRTSSLAENLDGAAELVEPGDAGALRIAMNTLLHDEQRRKSLRVAGIERATEFRWEESARRYVALYEDLAAVPSPR